MRLEAGQTINRAPEDVFRFVATDHFRNHPTWDPAVEELTPTSAGPMGQGATARLIRRDRGRRTEGTVTVVEYDPAHAFGAISRFGPFTLRQRITLESVPQGATRLRLIIDTSATGPVHALLPLLRGQFRKTMRASLLSIKEHLEAQPPA